MRDPWPVVFSLSAILLLAVFAAASVQFYWVGEIIKISSLYRGLSDGRELAVRDFIDAKSSCKGVPVKRVSVNYQPLRSGMMMDHGHFLYAILAT